MEREMPSSVELTGEWLLPGVPDHVVTGTVTWNSVSGGELVVIGPLVPSTPAIDPHICHISDDELHEGQIAAIFGRGDGRNLTLIDATRVGRTINRPSGQVSERYHFMTLLEGSLLPNAGSAEFVGLSVSLRHLATWIGRTAFSYSHSETNLGDENWRTITASDLPAIEFSTPVGPAKFWHALERREHQYHKGGFEEDWRLEVTGDVPLRVDALLGVAGDLQDLVSLASGDCAEFGPAYLTHPDVRIRKFSGETIEHLSPMQYFVPWSNRSRVEPGVNQSDLLFTFDDLGGGTGVSSWCEAAAKYRLQLGTLLGTRYNEHMYLEDRLLNACVLLESFDKERRPKTATDKPITYADRVRACVDLVGPSCFSFLPDDVKAWRKVVKDQRLELAHRGRSLRLNDDHGHWILWQQVFWLLACCILKEANAPKVVFDKIAKHRSVRELREH